MIMHENFSVFIDSILPKVDTLINMDFCTPLTLPKTMPSSGIYLFSEGNSHLYIGRSNNIRRRIKLHSRPGSAHNQATFAFLMARQKTGNVKATYKKGDGSRVDLIKDPEFFKIFQESKDRIRSMSVRFVEETDPTRQAFLEIYAAVVLQTPYNDFSNH